MERVCLALASLSLACGAAVARPSEPTVVAQAEEPVASPDAASSNAVEASEPSEGATDLSAALPGLSADGRLVALLSTTGDGSSQTSTFVWIGLDGTGGGELVVSESRAWEENTPAEAERERDAEAARARMTSFLSEHRFRPLVRLSEPGEPEIAGAPAFEWTEDGWVTFRDRETGRVRYHERVVTPDPDPPGDLSEEELDEWYEEHRCDVPGLDSASARLIDRDRVLLVTTVSPVADECPSDAAHRVVLLAPRDR